MYQYDYKIRVRYSETDQMGIVYYGNYAKYYEIGRVETIRSLGVSYKNLEEDEGIMLPVVRMEAKFIKGARYDEELTIRTFIKELPDKMITFHTNIHNSQLELINKAVVKLFFVEKESGKIVNAPEQLINKLKPFFG